MKTCRWCAHLALVVFIAGTNAACIFEERDANDVLAGMGGAGGAPGSGGAAGAAGPGGTTGATGSTGGGSVVCMTIEDCNDNNPCTTDTCTAGQCAHATDDMAVPDDNDDCTADKCMNGNASHALQPAGSPCGLGLVCDQAGQCHCTSDAQCGTSSECLVWACLDQICVKDVLADGMPLPAQTSGDCKERQCDGNGSVKTVVNASDVPPDDGKVCTVEACSGSTPVLHVPQPAGTECGTGSTCTSGSEKAPDACNASGACVAGAQTACGSFQCGPGACKQSCTVATEDQDCVATAKCLNGTCVVAKPLGQPCSTGEECTSGHCADGVCCTGQCDGDCQRCDYAISKGYCTLVNNGNVDVCAAGEACTGGVCAPLNGKKAMGSPCASGSDCAGTPYCDFGMCQWDYGSYCNPGEEWTCVTNFCKGGLCTSCASGADCESGLCTSGHCRLAAGKTCYSEFDCASGNCLSNLCQ